MECRAAAYILLLLLLILLIRPINSRGHRSFCAGPLLVRVLPVCCFCTLSYNTILYWQYCDAAVSHLSLKLALGAFEVLDEEVLAC